MKTGIRFASFGFVLAGGRRWMVGRTDESFWFKFVGGGRNGGGRV